MLPKRTLCLNLTFVFRILQVAHRIKAKTYFGLLELQDARISVNANFGRLFNAYISIKMQKKCVQHINQSPVNYKKVSNLYLTALYVHFKTSLYLVQSISQNRFYTDFLIDILYPIFRSSVSDEFYNILLFINGFYRFSVASEGQTSRTIRTRYTSRATKSPIQDRPRVKQKMFKYIAYVM